MPGTLLSSRNVVVRASRKGAQGGQERTSSATVCCIFKMVAKLYQHRSKRVARYLQLGCHTVVGTN